MQYRMRQEGGGYVISLEGQLNFAANEEFQGLLEQLASCRNANVTLDLSGITHVDSVGLGLLYVARDDLADRGSTIVLAHPRGKVVRLLELTQAAKTFTILP